MVIDTTVGFPADMAVHSAIDEHVARAVYLDAVATSEALFGDEQFANMLLVGAACQAGALPVSAASIERAIEAERCRREHQRAGVPPGQAVGG